MTLKELVQFYRKDLAEEGTFVAVRMPTGTHTHRYDEQIQHSLWMLDQMDAMLDERGTCEENCRSLEKFHRWLGFIQGMQCSLGYYSVDELREHTRKALHE